MRVNNIPRFYDAHRIVPRFLRRLLATGDDDVEIPMVASSVAVHPHASVSTSPFPLSF
jgi:hypothetical protein